MTKNSWDKPALIERWEYAHEKSEQWRINAALNYSYYDGTGHWTAEEIQQLTTENRPFTILNYTFKAINTMIGNEIQNRNEIHVFPMEGSDVQMANILNYAFKYVKKENNLDWRTSQANMDGYITGQGWLKNYVEVDAMGNTELIVKQRNPLIMYFDPDCIELDLEDCQDIHEVQFMHKNKLYELYPKYKGDIEKFLNAKDIDNHDLYVNDKNGLCRVIYSEYKKYERRPFWIIDGMTVIYDKDKKVYTDAKTGRAIDGNPTLGKREYTTTVPCVYGVWMLGDVELEAPQKNPFGCGENKFSYTLVCPYFIKGTGISVVDQVRSIQDVINKSFAQAMDILNRQPKVGGLYEEGAIDDPDELADMSRTGNWVKVKDLKRVQPLPTPQYPQAHMALVKDALDLYNKIIGTPEVFMGEAPGRVESALGIQILKKQSGLSFEHPSDNLRLAQIEVGRKILNQVMEFWSTDKAMRIVGEDGNFTDVEITAGQINIRTLDRETGQVKFDGTKPMESSWSNKLKNSKYDFVIDVNVPSVTQRMYNQILAMDLFNKIPAPQLVPLLIDVLDFPQKEKWVAALTQGMQQQGMQPGIGGTGMEGALPNEVAQNVG